MHETEAKDRDRRERRAREAARKLKPPSGASKSRRDGSSDRRKKTSALDVIDKLDVTGIYGGGCKGSSPLCFLLRANMFPLNSVSP